MTGWDWQVETRNLACDRCRSFWKCNGQLETSVHVSTAKSFRFFFLWQYRGVGHSVGETMASLYKTARSSLIIKPGVILTLVQSTWSPCSPTLPARSPPRKNFCILRLCGRCETKYFRCCRRPFAVKLYVLHCICTYLYDSCLESVARKAPQQTQTTPSRIQFPLKFNFQFKSIDFSDRKWMWFNLVLIQINHLSRAPLKITSLSLSLCLMWWNRVMSRSPWKSGMKTTHNHLTPQLLTQP